jgi:hypothetical protein
MKSNTPKRAFWRDIDINEIIYVGTFHKGNSIRYMGTYAPNTGKKHLQNIKKKSNKKLEHTS